MPRRCVCGLAVMLVAAVPRATFSWEGQPAGNWPCFRGVQACGVADGAGLPETWEGDSAKNTLWKTEIPGLGLSSPIVWEDRVYVTTAVNTTGESQLKVGLYGDPTSSYEKPAEHSWRVLCLERATGKIVWEREATKGVPKTKRHPKASHANCTPATDGQRLIAFFGSEGMYCYDMQGKLLWSKDFGVLDAGPYDDPNNSWGYASSPTICGDRVIVQCDIQEGGFVAALSLEDGRELWRTARKDYCTWSTPTVLQTADRHQVICNGYKHIGGYDFTTGKELWKLRGGGDAPVCTPIVAHEMIFITNAHGPMAPIYAISPEANGKLTATEGASSRYLVWFTLRGGNYMQTPIVYGDLLYCCRDNGVLTVYEAKSGEKVYSERLGKGTTGFTASPVAADGRVYFTSEEGEVFVVKTGRSFELIGTTSIGESCLATPVITEGTLLVRGQKHIHALGRRRQGERD